MTPVRERVRRGYDAAAAHYDGRDWQRLWTECEAPLLAGALGRLLPVGPERRIVDVGAGTGLYTRVLTPLGYVVTGIDLSAGMLARHPAGRRVQGSADALPFASGAFDGLVSARMIGHLEDLDGTLREWARVVRRGGVAVVTEVAAEHGNPGTQMPTDSGLVEIPTLRHDDGRMTAAAAVVGLRLVESRRLDARSVPGAVGAGVDLDRSGERPFGALWVFRRD